MKVGFLVGLVFGEGAGTPCAREPVRYGLGYLKVCVLEGNIWSAAPRFLHQLRCSQRSRGPERSLTPPSGKSRPLDLMSSSSRSSARDTVVPTELSIPSKSVSA